MDSESYSCHYLPEFGDTTKRYLFDSLSPTNASSAGTLDLIEEPLNALGVEDFYHLNKYLASLCITLLSVIVALNNVIVNFLVKLAGGRHKLIYIGGTVMVLAGCLAGLAAFHWHLQFWILIAGFLLLAFPAGFFSFYSIIAKNLNPPEMTGLAVAVLNFAAFVFIALFGNISGIILNYWKSAAVNGVFPGEAYSALFVFLSVSALISMAIGFFIPETGKKEKSL